MPFCHRARSVRHKLGASSGVSINDTIIPHEWRFVKMVKVTIYHSAIGKNRRILNKKMENSKKFKKTIDIQRLLCYTTLCSEMLTKIKQNFRSHLTT